MPEASLFGEGRYISLTTFRKSGKAVPTPVWFVERPGKIYFRTEEQAGKSKRLRNNPNVEMAACTARGKVTGTGPAVKGTARLLSGREPAGPAQWILDRYGWQVRIIDFLIWIQRKQPVYFEITPAV